MSICSIRSDRKYGLVHNASEPRWASLSLFDVPLVPPVPISRGRTVIFYVVEYLIMEWTMPNESRICRICRRVLIRGKKKKSVAGQFAAVKYRSG